MRSIHALCLFKEIAYDLVVGFGINFPLQPVEHLLNIVFDLDGSSHVIELSYYRFIILWNAGDFNMPSKQIRVEIEDPSAEDSSLPSQEITIVSHCLLNPLTRVKGLSPVHFSPAGPVIQLPCPEALYMGLDRWTVTKNQMDVPQFRRFCRTIIVHYADLMEMLARGGARLRIVGVARSPSCGVDTTSIGHTGGRVAEQSHAHVAGRGVFMEELLAEMERRGVACRAEEVGASARGE